jgi:DNA-binding transcriptional LysR family regulator
VQAFAVVIQASNSAAASRPGVAVLPTPEARTSAMKWHARAATALAVARLPVTSIETLIRSGALVRVLPEWRQPLEPLSLYFASQRRKSAALSAFIAFLQANPGR